MERAGRFPKRRYLTTQLVGWLEHEIDEWILSRSHRRLR
jgi:predicted DNA-binding transcriptional regulator AlpA